MNNYLPDAQPSNTTPNTNPSLAGVASVNPPGGTAVTSDRPRGHGPTHDVSFDPIPELEDARIRLTKAEADILAEVAARIAAIATEAATRLAADVAESNARIAADNAEAAARAAADAAEATARANADTAETNARIAADSAEASTRAADDATEAATRGAADTSLSNRITTLETGAMKNVVLVSQQLLASNTTPQAIPELAITLGANQIWSFEIQVIFNCTLPADFAFRITVPAGTTLIFQCSRIIDGAAATFYDNIAAGVTKTADGTGSNVHFVITGTVLSGATTGTMQFEACQRVSTAEITDFVVQGSNIKADRHF